MRTALALLAVLLSSRSATRADDFTWAGQLSGTNYDYAFATAIDASGNVYSAGYFYGTADFDPGPGTFNLTAGAYDVFVSKLDGAGNLVWARNLGGPQSEYAQAIAVGGSGTVYVTGHFQGTADFDPGPGAHSLTSAGGLDVFVSKLDGAGNLVWARNLGGSDDDHGQGVAVDAAGNVYTTGYFLGTADFNPGLGAYLLTAAGPPWSDAFVSKLDGAGNFVWAKQLGGSGEDFGQGVAVDASGGVYATGAFNDTVDFDPGPAVHDLTSTGGSDIFVSKLDGAGNFVWAKQLGGPYYGAQGYGIAVDGGGRVHTTGYFDGIVDFDPGPGVHELTSFSGNDSFVSKLDGAGNFVWARQLGGNYYDEGRGIAVDAAGSVYTTGWFFDVGDFDPGSDAFNLTSAGGNDVFVSKLDGAGSFVWAKRLGGPLDDHGRGIAADKDGNVHVSGHFWDTIDVDPGPNAFNLTSTGRSDAFVWKRIERCGPFVDESGYGQLVFPRWCTRDANELPGVGGEPYLYDSASLDVYRGSGDVFYLSSDGNSFSRLVVDDSCQLNGQDSGIGGYSSQPGVPPFQSGVPIEDNFLPQFPPDVTHLIPLGASTVLFEAYDFFRQVYGHTPVYLVRDCGIRLGSNETGQTTIRFISFAVDIDAQQNDTHVVTGQISELRADLGFARATCLGTFLDTTQAVDSRPDPPIGEGYYYLARGTCSDPTYGQAKGITPDPRNYLVTSDPCP